VKHYDLARMVYLISVRLGILVITLGLVPVQAATYEGEWTKIVLDKVNASSLDLTGTVKVTGPDLTPKNYNLPATISATRLASLAKGFLRGGVYGVAIDAAMTGAGWLWNEARREWEKEKVVPPPDSLTGLGYCKGFGQTGANTGYGTGMRGLGCYTFPGGSGEQINNCYLVYPTETAPVMFDASCPAPGETVQNIPATPQDIFDDGVKPNAPTVIPNIITGLPQVIGTPTAQLKPPSLPSIHWPEVVLNIIDFINNLNFTQTLFDIVNQAFTDISTLTQTQINTLINNGIDIQTLINAINNTINNTTLTTEEKNQLNLWNNLQTSTTTPPVTVPPEPVAIEIPTDCDLIPFVCAWLEWYRGWLTEEPPPIPESVIPIEEPDFDLWPTATEGSCPPPHQFSVFGQSVEVSYQPWCDLAILIAPLLMALGWLFASYIVLRVR